VELKNAIAYNLRNWLEKDALPLLQNAGVCEGQIVLDFGCGTGNYAVAASQIVRKRGKVYAVDKERWGIWPSEGLDKLSQKVHSWELNNIILIKTSGELKLDLPDHSIDVALLFDTLHYYYFPEKELRLELLAEVNRVLKPKGILLFYPGDPEASGNPSEVNTIVTEIENTYFSLRHQYTGVVVHEELIQKGTIRVFEKRREKS
jgi:ubiquinone/menaquinone biosynthesis C-methylase UbiE